MICSLPVFSHSLHYPQSNWALLVLLPEWVGFRTFQDPLGLFNKLSCEAGSFSHCCLNLHRCFQSEALRLYFPVLEPWVVRSDLLPSCSSQFICMQMWDCPVCKPLPHWVCQLLPCHKSSLPGCPSPPLLLVWMNVSSLIPWLSDFHTVLFSVSSGCFLFLNLLFSFFWLCEEAQYVYLSLHLGQKFRRIKVLNDLANDVKKVSQHHFVFFSNIMW